LKYPDYVNYKQIVLGQSAGGLDILLWVFKLKQDLTVISMSQKPVIIIAARSLPCETPGSWVIEGFLKQIQQSNELRRLLMICDIHILPVLNPDGVVAGNSRATLQGQKFSKSKEGLVFHSYLQSMKKHKIIEYLFLSKSNQDVISLP
jgi:murein tripeptide amidase MpaA